MQIDSAPQQHPAPELSLPVTASTDPSPQPDIPALSLRGWLGLGQRAAFFRSIDISNKQITAFQFALVVVVLMLVELALSRWEIAGPAKFNLYSWLGPWISLPVLALFVWWVIQQEPRAHASPVQSDATGQHRPSVHLGSFLAVSNAATIPLAFVSGLFAIFNARSADAPPELWMQWFIFIAWWGLLAWFIGITYWVSKQFRLHQRSITLIVIGTTAISLGASYFFQHRPYQADYSESKEKAPQYMQLSQQLFEYQSALLQNHLAKISSQRDGTRELYAVVFAPYASENVFLNEARMVSSVLNEHFDTQERLVQLVNHTNTTATLAWATPLNLERTINALAQKMDKNGDILLLYLTSHGANDFKLAASHWPLDVPTLTPTMLAKMLDDAGIRHRVVIISACYAGGWLPPLSNDYSLVMSAADATHTSYGCGHKSELTYFGRALFDEQLRSTHSFDEAFQKAVPIIKQRENDAGKTDGFSNPQISMGSKMKTALDELALRLQTSVK